MNKLPNDPVIDEIREVRHRISARFGHDPERLLEHYMEVQQQYRARLVDGPTAQDRSTQGLVGQTHG